MRSPIEVYTPQIYLEKTRKMSLAAWAVLSFVALAWIAVIIGAPVAESSGLTGFSRPVYHFYSYICHQIPERSFSIFGYPFAVCSRCFGFYAGFLLGMVFYPLFFKIENVEPLPRFWLFLAMIPMGIDWSLGFFHIWENTHLSRAITGIILGAACAVFIVPALAELVGLLIKGKIKRPS
jgi:uncharacterized membrane protein